MIRKLTPVVVVAIMAAFFCSALLTFAEETDDPNVRVQSGLIEGLKYRSLGFSRGGRSTAATGIPGQPLLWNNLEPDGRPVGRGIYFLRVRVGNETTLRKVHVVH